MFFSFVTSLLAAMIVSFSPSGTWRSFIEAIVEGGNPSETGENNQTNEVEVEDNNQANEVEITKQTDNQ